MHAIPTTYSGVQFRSRLEARWAAFFDLLKIKWLYEPFDLAGYIPDFILPEFGDLLVEVKPILHMSESGPAMDKIRASGWTKNAVVVGACLWTQFCPRNMGGYSRESIDAIGNNIAIGVCYECVHIECVDSFCKGAGAELCAKHGMNCPEESIAFWNLGMFTDGKFLCLRNGHKMRVRISGVRLEDYLSSSSDVPYLWKKAGSLTQWKGNKARH